MNQRPTYNPLELLRRWVQGKTPLKEERQLEQLAEEDSFLAEALEGYRSHPEGRHVERVEGLKERLKDRTGKRRSFLFYLPRAAAAVVLVAITAGGFWYVNQEVNQHSALAVQENKLEETGDALSESSARKEAPEAPAVPQPQEEVLPLSKTKRKELSAPSKPAAPEAKETRRPPGTEEIAQQSGNQIIKNKAFIQPDASSPRSKSSSPKPAADDVEPSSFSQARIIVEEEAAENQADSKAIARAAPAAPDKEQPARPTATPRIITGTVTDPDGAPLIGVNILLEGTTYGTVTDLDGQFALEVPDSISNLIVAYTGFESQTIAPGKEDSLTIALTEGEVLLEQVAVTGYAAKRKAPLSAPEPKVGFAELRQYIRENLRYPDAARRKGIEGKVKLTFRIQADGTPDNFEVKRGLTGGCNEEAIRLLKEGPKWEGAGQKATYTIRFKL